MAASKFDAETEISAAAPATGDGDGDGETGLTQRFECAVSSRWNIGDNPNGGYLAAAPLLAMGRVAGQPDPLSVTTHFLRPGLGGEPGQIVAHLIRPGRRTTTVSAELHQGAKQRLHMVGAFGDLSTTEGDVERPELTIPPVRLPDPEDCMDRRLLEQGVELPILDRLDVRIDPQWAIAGASDRAEVSGWIRFGDGRAVDSHALTLFGDAFPPSVFSLLGTIGWVPTLELTVHVRRRPVPGWIRARFTTEDLSNDLLIENGELWDEDDQLVARTRQLALLL